MEFLKFNRKRLAISLIIIFTSFSLFGVPYLNNYSGRVANPKSHEAKFLNKIKLNEPFTTPHLRILSGSIIKPVRYVKGAARIFKESYLGHKTLFNNSPWFPSIPPNPQKEDSLIQAAQRSNELAKQNGLFIENIDQLVLAELPVGIKKTIGNIDYIIVIERAKYLSDKILLTASMTLMIPEKIENSNHMLTFYGKDIEMSYEGKLMGSGRLDLIGQTVFNFGRLGILLKGRMGDLNQENGLTFIQWGCKGFEKLHLAGEIHFDSNQFAPEIDGKVVRRQTIGNKK